MIVAADGRDRRRAAWRCSPIRSGAVFSVWQAGHAPGAELVNEPGTWSWSELLTTDVEASKAFYGAVFGWAADDPRATARPVSTRSGRSSGRSVGGMMQKPPMMPAEVPPFWAVYFAVADTDAAVDARRRARRHGGDAADGHRARSLRRRRRPDRRRRSTSSRSSPSSRGAPRPRRRRPSRWRGREVRRRGRRSCASGSRSSTPTPSARSCTTTRSSSSRPRSCRRRPPTRTSTRSRPRCSRGTRPPADLAHADPDDVERLVFQTGFYRSKTKNLLGMARMLDEDFDGEVPTELDDLVKLPGRRPQDRQRRALGRVRPPGPAGRHARRSAVAPAQAHHRERPGEGRARPQRARPARGARALLAAADPARPAGVLRPQARLRAVRAASTSARRPIPRPEPRLATRQPSASRPAGAVERPVGAEEGPLGLVELGGDGAVVGVAVAVTDGDDPRGQLVELRLQAGQLGEVGRCGHGSSLR